MTATHPGTISFDDKTTGRQWTEAIADLPETMAWVQTSDPEGRIAVARIEITGAPGQRRITKFAADGTMLESTPQAPPPPASPGP